MKRKQDCEVKLHWRYVRDQWGVPDGKKSLKWAECSCCRKKLQTYQVEQVDCGVAYHMECPNGHCSYSWYDLIEEC